MLALFKSHYSIGRSSLTLNKPDPLEDGRSEHRPDSIFEICQENDLKTLCLVDDSLSGYLEASVNSRELGIKLVFGLRLTICEDMNEKTQDSLITNSKYIVFCKNKSGYDRLVKTYSQASLNGFYYEPRLDIETLKKLWSEKDLMLAVPFYDSFLFNNILRGGKCIPDLSFAKPVFFLESNSLPFDEIIKNKIEKYTKNKFKCLESKSIYYKNKEDFLTYLSFRCIHKRTTLSKPELDHMCSNEFCFGSWKERNDQEA